MLGVGAGVEDVLIATALGLHELHGEPEEPARLVADHFQVVVLRGAGQRVAPEQVHALSAVQVQQLLGVYLNGLRALQLLQLAQRAEVDVVGRVDGLRGAEDAVGHGDAATQHGGVFDVVDKEGRGVQHADDLRDDLEASFGDFQPGIEGGDELGANVFARVAVHVVVGPEENLFFFFRPFSGLWRYYVIAVGHGCFVIAIVALVRICR